MTEAMMAVTMTADETRAHYETAMGADLGGVYYLLWQELAALHVHWAEYRAAFGTSAERVALLNKAAPNFVGLSQRGLWHDILLTLCRFTDPWKTAGRETLSLNAMPALIADFTYRTSVLAGIKAIDPKVAFARDWRNRYLAHRDRELALDVTAEPLAPASRAAVQAVVDAITELMGDIERHFCKTSPTAFEHSASFGDGESLLRVVRDGLDARDAALERMEAGTGDGTFFTRPLP
jgi:hypothetical protein